jgi:hypothetical protein
MPSIEIHDSTFERLQRHARPFVDSPDAVINKALDALEGVDTTELKAEPGLAERRIDPRSVPNLTHTKVLQASIGGDVIARPNWNRLLDEVLRRAMRQLGNFEKVRKLCPVNMVQGRKADEGYDYLSDIRISVQGQDANAACRAVIAAAQGLGIEVDIAFMWRLKEGAAHPGEHARILVPARRGVKAA